MKKEYQELMTTVSQQVAQTFLHHEDNLAARALLVDADIAEITRQIGLETTKIVVEHVRDDLVKQPQHEGFVIQKRPVIRFNVICGPRELSSPYVWQKYGGAKPLRDEMNLTHEGRSEAVTRALSDFGSEDSVRHAAKRFTEHDTYSVHSSTVSRVAKQGAEDAFVSVEQTLSDASEDSANASTPPTGVVESMVVELDGREIRTAVFVPGEQAQDRTPIRQAPKKQKVINWRDVRRGVARPLDSLAKTYVGKKASSPEVVSDLVQAAA